jgi:BirA family biotin operon repressor/biotin-[acetyl-CoA-carboxylase] ligase
VLGRRIVALASVDSTMLEAKRAIAAESESSLLLGTVFVADEQTAGVGRRGRSWQSTRDAGLYFTFVWVHAADSVPFKTAVKLNFATPLAVVEALRAVGVVDARVKWPNDVWVGTRKICGMLVDNEQNASIVGVGINLNEHFAENDALSQTATSVAHELRQERFDEREAVLADILTRLEQSIAHESLEQVLERYAKVHLLHGRVVRVHHKTREESDERDYDATVLGLSPFGFLRVQPTAPGSAVAELSGEEVTIRPSQ